MLGIKKIGNLHCFSFNKEGRPRFCIGPHWPFFACLMTLILLMALFFVFHVGPSVSPGLTLITCLVFGSLIFSYTAAAFVNPGIAMFEHSKVQSKECEDSRVHCNMCEVYMDSKVTHCDECDVCILDYDHHCPWTSKCIGKGNMCFFNAFLVSILFCFVFAIISLGLQARAKRLSRE